MIRIALAAVAATCCLFAIVITLMLAPKGGVAAGTAKGLVMVGTTSVERRLRRLLVALGAVAMACCLAAAALA